LSRDKHVAGMGFEPPFLTGGLGKGRRKRLHNARLKE
jgi:hypothetical protein